ncbi:MAG: M20/M25/M40 family metallo-hydrolase [Candidatus Dojkabacteria bacterium]|nr:M20/M25/M40 family metallo-hydrolase [Candidatus Dojkabacteria bacterium]MDQ7021413.1 M20/M25/M40 family metallo-hydrolase [Candidatus Dojkabacteria bacterium]
MKELLFDLLKFESTEEKPSKLYGIVDHLDMYFNEINVTTRMYEKNKKPSFVVTTKFTKSPKIFLSGHLDVVPADYDKAFEPYEKDGKIYARGTSDMKGVDAAMITAVKELVEEGADVDVGLMLTTDEEVGGFDGTNYLLEEQGYSSEVVFLPDGGEANWNVCLGEKGIFFVELESESSGGHGSRPWEVENPLNNCWKVYKEIRDIFREKWGRISKEDNWKPTINLSSLHGGDSFNKVPNKAVMKLDIRFPANTLTDSLMDELLKNACNKYNITYKYVLTASPASIDKDNQYIKRWVEVSRSAIGSEPQFYNTHGGSDGRFFGAKGIPMLCVKPNASSMHVVNEWIDYEDLIRFKDVLKQWILDSHK